MAENGLLIEFPYIEQDCSGTWGGDDYIVCDEQPKNLLAITKNDDDISKMHTLMETCICNHLQLHISDDVTHFQHRTCRSSAWETGIRYYTTAIPGRGW